jgi:hypothetical protein
MIYALKPCIVKGAVDCSHLKSAFDVYDQSSSKQVAQSICCLYKYVVLSHFLVSQLSTLFRYRFTFLAYFGVRVSEYNIARASYYVKSVGESRETTGSHTKLTNVDKLRKIINIMFARDIFGICQACLIRSPMMMVICSMRIAIYVSMAHLFWSLNPINRVILVTSWFSDIVSCEYNNQSKAWLTTIYNRLPCQKVLLGFNFSCRDCVHLVTNDAE